MDNISVNNIEADMLTPASLTSFANDLHFGYKNSNLKDWIEEKTKGKVKREKVVSISIKDIRDGTNKGLFIMCSTVHNVFIFTFCSFFSFLKKVLCGYSISSTH